MQQLGEFPLVMECGKPCRLLLQKVLVNECCKSEKACKIAGFFLVTGDHSPALFNLAEEAFDDIAVFVSLYVITLLPPAGRVRADAGFGV